MRQVRTSVFASLSRTDLFLCLFVCVLSHYVYLYDDIRGHTPTQCDALLSGLCVKGEPKYADVFRQI